MKLVEALEAEKLSRHRASPRRMELVFALSRSRRLKLDSPQVNEDLVAHLCHQVARAPRDLRTHVRRIYLNLSQADPTGSFGALLDLFIVLGPRGASLRRRMLDVAKCLLDREHYHALVCKLDSGVHTADPMPLAPASVLSKGARGSRTLVERLSREDTPNLQDPLDEARSCLEYGQLDDARAVLENALLADPGRLELHQELLEIYRATRDLEGFGAMWKLLDASRNPAVDAWRETADSLSLEALAGH